MKKFLLFMLCAWAAVLAADTARFCIFSDPQPSTVGTSKVKYSSYWYAQKAMQKAKDLGVDAVLVAGDISEVSAPATYREFRSLFDGVFGKDDVRLIAVMGNHDFWRPARDADPRAKKEETKKLRKEIFCKNLKMPSANQHVVINGIDVIGVSMAGGLSADKETTAYLQRELKKAADRDATKPIIVFAHNNIARTVHGSSRFSNNHLNRLFNKYPQAIFFSGHTHFPLEDERMIHQGGFTSVSTSTLRYTSFNVPMLPYVDSQLGKHMLYVTIDDSEVVIRRFQLRDDSEILDESGKPWTIKCPIRKADFTYDFKSRAAKRSAPVFAEGAALTAEAELNKNGEFTGVKLTGDTASHPNFVFGYYVKVMEKDADGDWAPVDGIIRFDAKSKKYEKVKDELWFPGDFYKGLNFRKAKFVQSIPVYPSARYRNLGFDFQPGKTYRIEVTAGESFGKRSTTAISTEITMPAKKAAK